MDIFHVKVVRHRGVFTPSSPFTTINILMTSFVAVNSTKKIPAKVELKHFVSFCKREIIFLKMKRLNEKAARANNVSRL